MENFYSPEPNLPEAPKTEEDLPFDGRPSQWKDRTEEYLNPAQLKSLRRRKDIESKEKNQELARRLVRVIFASLCILLLASALANIFFGKDTGGLTDRMLQILQSVLFTLIGYLFGRQSGERPS
ncbi:MAG: hypothetical protein LBG83_08725 [Oscillospiraceae bacterium]|jgi:hypothetical protein|nr:hypothetical protein [Oscillospiraceae bacterium]